VVQSYASNIDGFCGKRTLDGNCTETRSRFTPEPQYSLNIKTDRGQRRGSLTVRSTVGTATLCRATDMIEKKSSMEAAFVQADRITFMAPMDVVGAVQSILWRGELLHPDTLLFKNNSAAVSGGGDILLHPAGAPRQKGIAGTVQVDGGGPPPKFQLQFRKSASRHRC
jgi:hypothetical protein